MSTTDRGVQGSGVQPKVHARQNPQPTLGPHRCVGTECNLVALAATLESPMQPRWIVIVKGRAVGEFASRNAAFVFAERLEGPYSILRRPARTSKGSASKETRHREKTAASIKVVLA